MAARDIGVEPSVRFPEDDRGVRATVGRDRGGDGIGDDRRRADLHEIGERAAGVGGQIRGDRGDQRGRGGAIAVARQDGDDDLPGGRAGGAGVEHVGVRGERVEDVRAGRAGDRIALGREHEPAAELVVALVGRRDAAGGVAGVDHEPGDADEGGELVEVRADRERRHDGARGVVDAGAQQELAIGADLEQLYRRVALDGGVEGRHQRGQPREHLRVDVLIAERLHDAGRGESREIDGGVGGGVSHAAIWWRAGAGMLVDVAVEMYFYRHGGH